MWTGRVGTAPAKQEQTSVPPLTEAIQRSSRDLVVQPAEAVGRQRRAGGGDAAARGRGRGRGPGWTPALRQAMTYAAEVPKSVAPVRSAIRHWAPVSG